MSLRLHYAYDPLCGWCYAAAPLVNALRRTGWFTLALHGGGMLAGVRRRRMDDAFRQLIRFHEQRIEQLSGQSFGEAYTEGLLRDSSVVYDSGPPTVAILVAEALAGRGADMYAGLQQAHYVEGRSIVDRGVLASLAAALGIASAAFEARWDLEATRVERHYDETYGLLAQVGGQGYPTFAIERGGRFHRIDHGCWYGRPQAFVAELGAILDKR
jgi:putative protein-disulfide isomerase